MKHNRLIQLASVLTLTSPLVAEWQDCSRLPQIYNQPFWADECQSNIYLEIDYLLLFANQQGISPNMEVTAAGGSDVIGTFLRVKERDNYFPNRWDSGVRAALGFKPKYHSWDVRFAYTYFASNDQLDTNIPVGVQANILGELDAEISRIQKGIIPEYIVSGDNRLVVSLNQFDNSAQWRLNFNHCDLDFGREYYVSHDVTVRPHFGLRGMLVNQALLIDQGINIAPFAAARAGTKMDAKSHFRGVGVEAGLDSSITLFDGFDLYSNITGSILWGYSKLREAFSFKVPNQTSQEVDQVVDLNHSQNTTVFNLDLGIGLRWNQWMDCGRSLITFKFGWEQHIFSNLNQIQRNNTPIVIPSGFAPPSLSVSSLYDNNVYRGYLSLSGFVFGLSYVY